VARQPPVLSGWPPPGPPPPPPQHNHTRPNALGEGGGGVGGQLAESVGRDKRMERGGGGWEGLAGAWVRMQAEEAEVLRKANLPQRRVSENKYVCM